MNEHDPRGTPDPLSAAQSARPRRREPGGPEQRRHPRLSLPDLSVSVGVPATVGLLERGLDHIEFRSDTPLRPGQHLTLEESPGPGWEAEVLTCSLEESDPAWLEVCYRVRCRLLRPTG